MNLDEAKRLLDKALRDQDVIENATTSPLYLPVIRWDFVRQARALLERHDARETA